MTAIPMWFGPHERPLLGWFNTPAAGTARAGAVICPPFGRDYMHAHYALRLLAEGLAEQGICVVRFDYDGTGDSVGDDRDPSRVTAWLASVKAAIDRLRDSGVRSVFLIGMRLGATLAGVVAEGDGDIAGLVLWDPVVSGRAYLREQRATAALAFAMTKPSADGSVEAPGMVFDPGTARDLGSVDLITTNGPLADRVLVLIRPDRQASSLKVRLDLPHVEWAEAPGQVELMEDAPNQALPELAISRLIDWVGSVAPAVHQAIHQPVPAGPMVVGRDPEGMPIVETPGFFGPAGLFGIWTEVPGRVHGPTTIFLSVAAEHRIGPGRLWVDLARRWAGAGVRSLRLDLSGLGDSPTRTPDQRRFVSGAPEAFDDVVDAVGAASTSGDAGVVLIGHCLSGYQALESALHLGPRGVIAVNPVISLQPPEQVTGKPLDPRRQIALPRNALVRAFAANGALAGLRRRYPDLGWRLRMLVSPSRRPAVWLRQLERDEVDVLIVSGEQEAQLILLGASKRGLERLKRTGRFALAVIPDLEHGLFIADQRSVLSRLLTDHVIERFAAPQLQSTGERRLEVVTSPS
jgi:alpha-beta hydrolase superfamily lysophospholipase